MFLWRIVPTWQQLEIRVTQGQGGHGGAGFRGYLNPHAPSLALNICRFNSVKFAFTLAEAEARGVLRQRFADLDISSILDELIDVVSQMAMIVAGSVLAGGAIGAGIGVFAGGAGAIPFGIAGAAAGLQVSTWILGVLGLASIAEFFVEGWPRIGDHYRQGINIAWQGPRCADRADPWWQNDTFASQRASGYIAKGHVEVVVLLLGAIVAYLTRGRGDAGVLAREMRASPKGARLGQWMLKHEAALKKRTDLQRPEPHRGAIGPGDPQSPANRPPARDHQPLKGRSSTMPRHVVECFKADKMPASKIPEFERQLKGQENGLNWLTVDEYLENIANPVKRSRAAAREAREALEARLQKRFQGDFSQTMGARAAKAESIKKAKEMMSNLAGLHNPDLSAGGNDIIADFGDRQVNSSIGPQWRPKIANLKKAAETVPVALRGETYLNVKLHKC